MVYIYIQINMFWPWRISLVVTLVVPILETVPYPAPKCNAQRKRNTASVNNKNVAAFKQGQALRQRQQQQRQWQRQRQKTTTATTATAAKIDLERRSNLMLPETVARGCHVCDHWVYGPWVLQIPRQAVGMVFLLVNSGMKH